MDWDAIAPMVVAVVLIITGGGVLILRPIAKRISELLELYARDRSEGLERDVAQMRELMETMHARFQLLEERQDFTERLLSSGREPERPGRNPDDAGDRRS